MVEGNKDTRSIAEWLAAARGPYLEFLRNLTPQVLLASLAWVLALKLDFSRFDLQNFVPTFGFYAFLALFGFAVYSNISLLMSALFPGLMSSLRRHEYFMQEVRVAKLRVPVLLVKALVKERRYEVLFLVVVLVALEFVFAGVLASSIGAAITLVRATRA